MAALDRSNQSATGALQPPALEIQTRARLAALVVVLFAAALILDLRLPFVAGLGRTALLMPSFFGAGPVTPAPTLRLTVIDGTGFEGAEQGASLHVFAPAGGRNPALVVALGLHPADPNDPRVLALLSGLAARGIVAALIESPSLDQDRLTPDAPEDLVAAFQWLVVQPYVDPHRIGFLSFSVGGSLALLAAADPRIASRVRLVEALGPYASLESVARATLTGSFDGSGGPQSWQPDPLTRTAVPENLVTLLAPPADQPALLDLIQSPNGLRTSSGLSPSGQVIAHLLAASDPQTFDAAFSSLSGAQAECLRALSPVGAVSSIQAPVYLMVDRQDPLVPPNESVILAEALRSGGRQPYLSQFDLLRHVEPTRLHPSVAVLRDVLRLFWQANAVLQRLW